MLKNKSGDYECSDVRDRSKLVNMFANGSMIEYGKTIQSPDFTQPNVAPSDPVVHPTRASHGFPVWCLPARHHQNQLAEVQGDALGVADRLSGRGVGDATCNRND